MPILDPSEELFDRGAWGYGPSGWTKDPLRLGYTDSLDLSNSTVAAAAGETEYSTSVPAGQIWIVTVASVVDTSNAATEATIEYDSADGLVSIAHTASPVAKEPAVFTGQLFLYPTRRLRFRLTGMTVGDTWRWMLNGYKFVI